MDQMVMRTYHDAKFTYQDEYSKRPVEQLTSYLGHTNHLYFTDPCWIEDNVSMIVTSDRENRSNLFSLSLEDSTLRQLSNNTSASRPGGCFSQVNRCHYYNTPETVVEVNLVSGEERVLLDVRNAAIGEGAFRIYSRPSPNADGRYVIVALSEFDPADDTRVVFAYSDFHRNFQRKPLVRIVRIDRESGELEIIHEDRCFITHINPSPAIPHIMTFCHEGPWHLVDQRIWGLDILTSQVWRIRDQRGEDLAIGHEYWFIDGERLGYHGRSKSEATTMDGGHIYGHIRWDGSDCTEQWFPFHSTHFHSLDEHLIVGDGTPAAVFTHQGVSEPFIQLFRWNGTAYEGPRVLSYHRSTFNDQHCHPHPRISPDGQWVYYSSDLSGYANIYRVPIGNFDDLPVLTEGMAPQHT